MSQQELASDRLVGLQARNALEEASFAGGLRIQPRSHDDQAADEPWPVSHLRVHREEGLLEVCVQGSLEQMNFLARFKLFVLFIKFHNQQHESDALEVMKVQPGKEAITLFMELPKSFSKVFHREFFRVFLDRRLDVLFRVQLPQGTLSGRVIDISAGGCRVGLAFQLALQLLRPLPERLQITLEFPNGESVSSLAELTYLQPSDDFVQALVGWHFVHASQEDEKKWFHYTLETERELARLMHPDKENLKASRLFKRPKPTPTLAAKGKLPAVFVLSNQACQQRVLQVADGLAAQILLLAARRRLDSQRLTQVALTFIELVNEDRNALLFHLEQPLRKIHPVLLHSLRVAARCFPLLFKVGLTRRYELSAMTSLLLHDLGKFFLGHQPCFNPLKESAEALRKLKLHQIQLLRSASALRWIPKGLGESLMVNANERLDGSGYPRAIKAERLDALSRIMGVAKVLDCLVHGYNDPARSWQEAYQWVYKHPEWFDRQALNTFVTTHGLRPVGCRLEFKGDQFARVSRVSDRGQLEEVVLIKKMDSQQHILDAELLSGAQLHALGSPVKEIPRPEFNR